jgi:hypothetical protein
MANDSIQIYDHATGETIIRELTNEEQAIRDQEVAAFLADETAKIAEAEAAEQAKADAQAKLAALGLTTDDLKALGLGGN